jgi:pimeloyl-ACP methyl ester carboxylesterase
MRTLLVIACLTACASAAGAQVTSGTSSAGLFYEASGTGDAVVLVHAFSVDRRMWAPQIALLERRFRVVRYDLRGHGKSDGPGSPYAPHDDLRSVLDALGIGKATLIGLSAGSTLAIDFAIAYPDRVARLVLASPGLNGHVPSSPLTWTQPVFQAAGAGDAEGAARLWAGTPIMAIRADLSAAPAVRDLVMSNVRVWTYKANPARPLTPPAVGRLAEVKCPTLVILGERDLPHIKEIADLLAKGIPGATLATIPGAGHMVNLDARQAFDQAIDAFLTNREPGQARRDFSGEWVLNRAASTLSPGADAVQSGEVRIDHREPTFRYKASLVSTTNRTEYEYELQTDGRETAGPQPGPPTVSSLRWEGDTLVFIGRVKVPKGETTITFRYDLLDDGRRLRGAEQIRGGGREQDNVWIFDRR